MYQYTHTHTGSNVSVPPPSPRPSGPSVYPPLLDPIQRTGAGRLDNNPQNGVKKDVVPNYVDPGIQDVGVGCRVWGCKVWDGRCGV